MTWFIEQKLPLYKSRSLVARNKAKDECQYCTALLIRGNLGRYASFQEAYGIAEGSQGDAVSG